MTVNTWFKRLLAGTRGQIVAQLRHAPATISALADELGLSANAVRSHLTSLERDGLIEQDLLRQGVGKPAHLYRLTAAANGLTPKAYDQVLEGLLDLLRERKGVDHLALLDQLAERISTRYVDRTASFDKRLAQTQSLLVHLGAETSSERQGNKLTVQGSSCPLSGLVGTHPELCRFMERLIALSLGKKVDECCNRNVAVPRCCFVVSTDLAA